MEAPTRTRNGGIGQGRLGTRQSVRIACVVSSALPFAFGDARADTRGDLGAPERWWCHLRCLDRCAVQMAQARSQDRLGCTHKVPLLEIVCERMLIQILSVQEAWTGPSLKF